MFTKRTILTTLLVLKQAKAPTRISDWAGR